MARPKVYNIVLNSMRSHVQAGFSYQSFAFYVAIKMRYRNSTLYNPGARSVMRLLGCSYGTARNLLAEARTCPLFKFTENNTKKGARSSLVAVVDRDSFAKISTTGDRKYVSDRVYKISNKNEGKNWTLRELVKELQNIAVVMCIGRIHADLDHCDHLGAEECVSYIRQKTIADIINLPRERVNVIIKRLARKGIITKSAQHCKELYHIADGQKVELEACEYVDRRRHSVMYGSILFYHINAKYRSKFFHIIWNHHGRIHSRRDTKEYCPEKMTEKERIKYYFKHKHD